jgi:acetyl esterase/lipase
VRKLAPILAAAALLAGCTVPRPAGDAPLRYRDLVFSGVTKTADVKYGTAPNLQGDPVDLKFDFYQPTGDPVKRRPVVVWVHGGGFSAGDKSDGADWATAFARRGFVAVSLGYRLLATGPCGGTGPVPQQCYTAAYAAQHDAQAAVRFLRKNAAFLGVDPARIAMAGESAGAVTSLLVGWRPDDPGTSGNPGPPSAPPSRSPAACRSTTTSRAATPPRCSSTAPPIRPSPTRGRPATSARWPSAT